MRRVRAASEGRAVIESEQEVLTMLAEMVPIRYKGARRRFRIHGAEKATVQVDLRVGTSATVVFTVTRSAKPDGDGDGFASGVTITPVGVTTKATDVLTVSGMADLIVTVTTAEGGSADSFVDISVNTQLAANTGNAAAQQAGGPLLGGGDGGMIGP